MVEEESRGGYDIAFCSYGRPLANVTEFNYLRRILTDIEDDWLEVVDNLNIIQEEMFTAVNNFGMGGGRRVMDQEVLLFGL